MENLIRKKKKGNVEKSWRYYFCSGKHRDCTTKDPISECESQLSGEHATT